MKDQEFKELLNLYLDHEISAADAERLETEVQRDPARREMYQDYCRLHKACSLLVSDATVQAPAKIEFSPERRSWFPNAYATAGLMAAAACATFVFINHRSDTAPSGAIVADNTVPAAALQATGNPLAPRSDMARSIPRTVTVLAQQEDGFEPVAGRTLRFKPSEATADSMQDLRLNWMEQMQLSSLSPVPADSLRFETKSRLKANPRNFGSDSPDVVETAAWQFQR